MEAQSSRVSIRPHGSSMLGTSDRPSSAAGCYSQFGARGGKFSSAKPKSDVDWAIYRAKQCPGPGEYAGVGKDQVPRGGRFNMSNPKSDIDWLIKKSSEEPGPGDYRLNEKNMRPGGGKFSTARPKSALDWTIFNARQRPGPGHYQPDAHYKVNGGRFSSAKPKSDVEWCIARAKQQPGPGQYKVTTNRMAGGKFNMSNPKSDVDWAILKAMSSPSPQDYNADAYHKIVGGRFSTSRPKSALDWEIYRSKQMPGPGEYNAELQSIGRRAGQEYMPSTPSNPSRPNTAHSSSLPPEARGKVRPKGLNESSESIYGVGNDRPKRPATATGIPAAARGKPRPQGMAPKSPAAAAAAAAPGKDLPPRATSAPPGPRMAPSSPISRPETPAGKADSRHKVYVAMPGTRPGSVPPKRSSNVYVGEDPMVYRPQSNRPASALENKQKSRPKTKTMGTQASEEDMVIFLQLPIPPFLHLSIRVLWMCDNLLCDNSCCGVCQRMIDRQMEEVERKRKRAASEKKNDSRGDKDLRSRSVTGRALSASDFSSSRTSNFASAPVRASKRIPRKDKNKVVYPMGVTRPAGNVFSVSPGSCSRGCRVKEQLALMMCGASSSPPRALTLVLTLSLVFLLALLAAVTNARSKLSDNARKLFDLAMQSGEFKKMMVRPARSDCACFSAPVTPEASRILGFPGLTGVCWTISQELYTGVKDPTDVIEKYAGTFNSVKSCLFSLHPQVTLFSTLQRRQQCGATNRSSKAVARDDRICTRAKGHFCGDECARSMWIHVLRGAVTCICLMHIFVYVVRRLFLVCVCSCVCKLHVLLWTMVLVTPVGSRNNKVFAT